MTALVFLTLVAFQGDPAKEKWTRTFAGLEKGMDALKAREAIDKVRGQEYNPRDRDWSDGSSADHRIYDLDGTWQILISFNERQLQSHRIIGFPDLRPEIDPDLYPHVRVVHESPALRGSLDFDPRALIRSVNALHPLGAERILTVCKAYERLANAGAGVEGRRRSRLYDLDEDRLYYLLLLLFVPKDGNAGMPEFRAGSIDWFQGSQANFPLYPLAVVDDVPFVVSRSLPATTGRRANPLHYISHCRTDCILRKEPLAPGSPVDAVDRLTASKAWKTVFGEDRPNSHVGQVRSQALRAVASLHNAKHHTCGTLSHDGVHHDKHWEEDASVVRALKGKWDPAKADFTR